MNNMEELVYNLSTKDVKKITPKMVQEEAQSVGLKKSVATRVWKNYAQYGVISETFDRRIKNGKTPARTIEAKAYAKKWSKEKFPHKTRKVYFKTAAKIILAVKNTDKQVYEVLDKYKVSKTQYYAWLDELSIKGTLLGRRVLDWNQYAKISVKDVIRYNRYPDSFIKKATLRTLQLQRISIVLDKYLK